MPRSKYLLGNEYNTMIAASVVGVLSQLIHLNLSTPASLVESYVRIEGLNEVKRDLIGKELAPLKINQDELISIISLGVLLIKTIDDILKITTNNRPTELLENKFTEIAESFLSQETKDSMTRIVNNVGLDKKALISGAKQFMYISSMLLADKYLSDKTGNISNAEILELSMLSSVLAVVGNVVAKGAIEYYHQNQMQANPPQANPPQAQAPIQDQLNPQNLALNLIVAHGLQQIIQGVQAQMAPRGPQAQMTPRGPQNQQLLQGHEVQQLPPGPEAETAHQIPREIPRANEATPSTLTRRTTFNRTGEDSTMQNYSS
jgi:hypothetical protein